MGTISLWHLIIGVGYFLLLVIPTWRILERVGRPGWIGVLAVVPIANLVLLWWLAYSRWPAERARM